MKPTELLYIGQSPTNKIRLLKYLKFRENEKGIFSNLYSKVDNNRDYGA